ncbi:GNAT family N-acetyltransferase [Sphingopyxis sp. KK2]|uniref:GNAT family N-acetyltransferase n=1 Tax=Sphingopyxis sp. KK2 TaxID=1855727 RepID=UPI00097E69C2|nr:GNAT family N-acetyltransferase [Sphingopyxis sp. KK2]
MVNVTIQQTSAPSEGDRVAILDVLQEFTRASVPILDNQDFAILLKDDAQSVIGGLVATSRWGGFHIEMVALPASLRRKRYGSTLLQLAEAEARHRGCHHIYLDTQAFQAKPFYERHGFVVFGQIDGPAPYYPRYFMQKKLR